MTTLQKTGIALLAIFIVLQFFHPARNSSRTVAAIAIHNVVPVPQEVHTVLKRACYDCHSNTTEYPWYSRVQPAAWYLANHIREGKRELNFSEFGTYSPKKQQHKLEEITGELEEGAMPLASYTLIHRDARLSDVEKALIINWANGLAARY